MTIVPRWEWRTFGDDFGAADGPFAELEVERSEESDETYLLSTESDASVKIRAGLLDVKTLQDVNDDGLEQWLPVLKASYPLPAEDARTVFEALGAATPALERDSYTLEQLVGELIEPTLELRAVEVHKHRDHYTVGGCMAELSEVAVDGRSRLTIAVESPDTVAVMAAVRDLNLEGHRNTCLARGLKALIGFDATR